MRRVYFAALAMLVCLIIMAPAANSLVFNAPFPRTTFVDAFSWLAHLLHAQRQAVTAHMPVVPPPEADLPVDTLPALLPLPGHAITSAFGPRIHPIFRRRIFHEGIDISAEKGDEVHCVLDGVVISAGWHCGFGNAVYVYHPTAQCVSMYAHMSHLNVAEGETIKQGTIVGLAGSTGFSTGPHLHFGVKGNDGEWQDPVAFLREVPRYEAEARELQVTAYGADLESVHVDAPAAPDLKQQLAQRSASVTQ